MTGITVTQLIITATGVKILGKYERLFSFLYGLIQRMFAW